MNFNKQIWKLFHMNRDDFNRFDRKCEKVLIEVFKNGERVGKKDVHKSIRIALNKLIK